MSTKVSLEEAIQSLIALGEKDPLEIVARLKRQQGDQWLRDEVAGLADDVAAWIARTRLGARRNVALVAREGKHDEAELLLSSKWVPEQGWKKMGDLTASDCRVIATHYVMLAEAAEIRARFYNEVASMIEAEGVRNIAALVKKRKLPALEELTDQAALTP